MPISRFVQTAVAALFATCLGGAAEAAPITFVTSPTALAVPGSTIEDFEGSFHIAGGSWSSVGPVSVVIGSFPGLFAQPYGDSTHYASVFSHGIAALNLTTPGSVLGLLWGSVDAYNGIFFFDAAHQLIQAFTGADVFPPANGNQGVAGTTYAYFTSTTPFTTVLFASSQNSFEFDNVSVSAVPLPAALPLFGAALAGLGVMRRRRIRKTAA